MKKIINARFEAGQKYIGLVNNEIFTVERVRNPGEYKTKSGGTYTINHVLIDFMNKKTGKVHQCELATAQRLLLKLI
ncbi:hypothetical protein LI291_10670 [Intestinibacillus massiliensis]|nr:hypothetical protein [Intestinibacillus massiliensis]